MADTAATLNVAIDASQASAGAQQFEQAVKRMMTAVDNLQTKLNSIQINPATITAINASLLGMGAAFQNATTQATVAAGAWATAINQVAVQTRGMATAATAAATAAAKAGQGVQAGARSAKIGGSVFTETFRGIVVAAQTAGIHVPAIISLVSGGMTRIIAQGAAVGIAFVKTTRDAILFEDAMVGVAKTANLTDKELETLGKQILDLSTRTGQSAVRLANLSMVVGQMGVTGVKNIERFTEVLARLEVTTDLVGEQGARQLSALFAVTDGGIEDIEQFEASIVALGNASEASESRIVDMATRIGQATGIFGISTTQALAFGTTLAEMGQRADSASTALSIVFGAMSSAVSEGGKSLRVFTSILGMTAEEFRMLVQEQPVQAFQRLTEAFHEMSETDVVKFLKELGITQQRTLRAFLPMIQDTGRLAGNLALANDAFDKGTAAQIEFARAMETTGASLRKAWQEFNRLSTLVGAFFAPFLGGGADIVGGFFRNMADDVANAKVTIEGLQETIQGILDAPFKRTAIGRYGEEVEGISDKFVTLREDLEKIQKVFSYLQYLDLSFLVEIGFDAASTYFIRDEVEAMVKDINDQMEILEQPKLDSSEIEKITDIAKHGGRDVVAMFESITKARQEDIEVAKQQAGQSMTTGEQLYEQFVNAETAIELGQSAMEKLSETLKGISATKFTLLSDLAKARNLKISLPIDEIIRMVDEGKTIQEIFETWAVSLGQSVAQIEDLNASAQSLSLIKGLGIAEEITQKLHLDLEVTGLTESQAELQKIIAQLEPFFEGRQDILARLLVDIELVLGEIDSAKFDAELKDLQDSMTFETRIAGMDEQEAEVERLLEKEIRLYEKFGQTLDKTTRKREIAAEVAKRTSATSGKAADEWFDAFVREEELESMTEAQREVNKALDQYRESAKGAIDPARELVIINTIQARQARALAETYSQYFKDLSRQADLEGMTDDMREINEEFDRFEDEHKRPPTKFERIRIAAETMRREVAEANKAVNELFEDLNQEQELEGLSSIDRKYQEIIQRVEELRRTANQGVTDEDRAQARTIALREFSDQFKVTAKDMEDFMVDSVEGMSDAFIDFAMTGKASFSDMVDSMIRKLLELAMQQAVLGPLMGILGGLFSTGGPTGIGATTASHNPSGYFARGGLVTRPTNAVIGEAGAEAVIPLSELKAMLGVTDKPAAKIPEINVVVEGPEPQEAIRPAMMRDMIGAIEKLSAERSALPAAMRGMMDRIGDARPVSVVVEGAAPMAAPFAEMGEIAGAVEKLTASIRPAGPVADRLGRDEVIPLTAMRAMMGAIKPLAGDARPVDVVVKEATPAAVPPIEMGEITGAIEKLAASIRPAGPVANRPERDETISLTAMRAMIGAMKPRADDARPISTPTGELEVEATIPFATMRTLVGMLRGAIDDSRPTVPAINGFDTEAIIPPATMREMAGMMAAMKPPAVDTGPIDVVVKESERDESVPLAAIRNMLGMVEVERQPVRDAGPMEVIVKGPELDEMVPISAMRQMMGAIETPEVDTGSTVEIADQSEAIDSISFALREMTVAMKGLTVGPDDDDGLYARSELEAVISPETMRMMMGAMGVSRKPARDDGSMEAIMGETRPEVIAPSMAMGGTAMQPTTNIVINNSSSAQVNAQARERQGVNGGFEMEVVIDMIEGRLADRMVNGRSQLAPTLQNLSSRRGF